VQTVSNNSGTITRWLVLAAVFIGLAFLCRLPSFVDAPLDRDEGAYALIAQQWSRGAMPYRDYFDHKPPVVYVAYRADGGTGCSPQSAARRLGRRGRAFRNWHRGPVAAP
jgi:hypothetical protein